MRLSAVGCSNIFPMPCRDYGSWLVSCAPRKLLLLATEDTLTAPCAVACGTAGRTTSGVRAVAQEWRPAMGRELWFSKLHEKLRWVGLSPSCAVEGRRARDGLPICAAYRAPFLVPAPRPVVGRPAALDFGEPGLIQEEFYSLTFRSLPSVQTSMFSDCMSAHIGPVLPRQAAFPQSGGTPCGQPLVDLLQQGADFFLGPVVEMRPKV